MASRNSTTIYIPKYFMAVRNCINISIYYGFEVRLATRPAYTAHDCLGKNKISVNHLPAL